MNTGLWDRLSADPEKGGPVIFGVRHHSPACARAVVAAAAELAPVAVAVEFPADLAEHLTWLAHPDLVTPVAVAVAGPAGSTAADIDAGMSLYPFADFSPELAVIRWAWENGVPVHAVDLPVGAPTTPPAPGSPDLPGATEVVGVSELVDRDAWDSKVETMSVGADWRAVRRAALAVGFASRLSETHGTAGTADTGDARDTGDTWSVDGVDPRTAARENWMRRSLDALTATPGTVLAVVGSFHAAALLPLLGRGDGAVESGTDSAGMSATVPAERSVDCLPVVSCLVPYSFAQLDSRSGYPSGIRDPRWRQQILDVTAPRQATELVTTMITDVGRALRAGGHPAGPAEMTEAVRLASGLAALRCLPAPGRGELLEALTSVFAQGSVAGHGRAVAAALEEVMVGDRTGELPPGAPEPVLLSAVRDEVAALGMPTRERSASKDVRVEPFAGRSGLARHVLLQRFDALGVPFLVGSTAGTTRGLENRSYTATVSWRTTTTAALSLLGSSGVTLGQVTAMVLLGRLSRAEGAGEVLDVLSDGARCGSGTVVDHALDALTPLLGSVGFAAAVDATELLASVAGGRLPATELLPASTRDRCAGLAGQLTGAVVREIEGVTGSDDVANARLLGRTASLVDDHRTELSAALAAVADRGSPLMSGAALAVLDRISDGERSTTRIGSWLDLGAHSATRRVLRRRLTGYLAASRGTWTTSGALDDLVERTNGADDDLFLAALPALRGAFDTVPAADREDFLDHLATLTGQDHPAVLDVPAEQAAGFAATDAAARRRLAALGLADVHFAPATRWRLILGAEPDQLPPTATRLGMTLDELYGDGGDDPTGAADGRVRRGGGGGARRISVRSWAGEIEALFGTGQVEEILATAAEQGRVEALLGPQGTGGVDPELVRPSVELLTSVLNLRGALSESQLQVLRPLVATLVDELSKQLASRITPVLAGLSGSRPTLRRTGRLDLPATIRRNLRHVAEIDGRRLVVPRTPVFRAPVRRTSPWHLIVLVDVSPSMERSTVYAAVTAAILSGVTTFRLSFLTFDSEVIDLSEHAADPLTLLLEVSPGGGTDIALAVAVASSMVTDPTRTAVIVVSDFEEGGPVDTLVVRVRDLVESGVRMLGCAALTDGDAGSGGTGVAYNVGITRQLAAVGMRVAPVSPVELARWVGEVLG